MEHAGVVDASNEVNINDRQKDKDLLAVSLLLQKRRRSNRTDRPTEKETTKYTAECNGGFRMDQRK